MSRPSWFSVRVSAHTAAYFPWVPLALLLIFALATSIASATDPPAPLAPAAPTSDPSCDAIKAGNACFSRAASAELAGDFAGAVREYESFASAHPEDRLAPLAVMATGNIHFLTEQPAQAVAAYDRVVAKYPESIWASEAARRKAECLQAEEQWAPAGQAYGEALVLAGKCSERPRTEWVNEVSLAAADCYDRAGDQAQVITLYESVLQNRLPSESSATVLLRLGERYEAMTQPKQAAERYAQLIRSYPASDAARQAYAKRELIEPHTQIDWDTYLEYAAAGDSIRQRHYEGALPKLDKVLAKTSDPVLRECAEFRQIVAETMVSADFTRGQERLESFLASAPVPDALPNTEPVLLNYRFVADAERRASERPDDAGALRSLGEALVQVRAFPKGIETLERAQALAPNDADLAFTLGTAYLNVQRTADAQKAFGVYLEQNPDDTNALNLIGYSCLGAGDAEAAVRYFERYAALAPDDPNAHDSLAEGYLTAGRLEDSVREYERALEIDPTFVNSQFMLGRVHQQMGASERAIASYRRFLEMSPAGDQADQARAALQALEQEGK